jgi:hypothetical protein
VLQLPRYATVDSVTSRALQLFNDADPLSHLSALTSPSALSAGAGNTGTGTGTGNRAHNGHEHEGEHEGEQEQEEEELTVLGCAPLQAMNTVVVDINAKEKGRYGKMLDKK